MMTVTQLIASLEVIPDKNAFVLVGTDASIYNEVDIKYFGDASDNAGSIVRIVGYDETMGL